MSSKPKLTARELAILRGAFSYGISDVGGQYYQLGGHGIVQVRFHPSTLANMERKGVLTRRGYWTATKLGASILNEIGNPHVI